MTTLQFIEPDQWWVFLTVGFVLSPVQFLVRLARKPQHRNPKHCG